MIVNTRVMLGIDFDSFISMEQNICNRYVRTFLLKYLSFILQITGEYVHVKGRILPYWL